MVMLAMANGLFAQDMPVGPENGTLILVGGGGDIGQILEHFVEIAGGPEAAIVVIPTAGAAENYDDFWPGLRIIRRAGAKNIKLFHTRERQIANTESFVEPIRDAAGVWISGGRQWRLADAYLNTKVHEELRALLDRGGVIGGSSAGATIQGSYLARGDTKTNTVIMGDHEEGFSFLRNVAVDQHLLVRNRQFDLLEVVRARPEILGIGIDENTAIVVRNDRFEVMGKGYVVIYDRNRRIPPAGHFYFLAPGDTYNLRTREPFRQRTTGEPLDRVVVDEW